MTDREQAIGSAAYVKFWGRGSINHQWDNDREDNKSDMIEVALAAVSKAREIDYAAEKPLTFGIDGDCLVISIGIKALAGAAETCDGLWDGDRDPPYVTIKDFKAFAAAIAMELDKRQADPEGNDGLDRLLDRAIVQVIVDGFEYGSHQPKEA